MNRQEIINRAEILKMKPFVSEKGLYYISRFDFNPSGEITQAKSPASCSFTLEVEPDADVARMIKQDGSERRLAVNDCFSLVTTMNVLCNATKF